MPWEQLGSMIDDCMVDVDDVDDDLNDADFEDELAEMIQGFRVDILKRFLIVVPRMSPDRT